MYTSLCFKNSNKTQGRHITSAKSLPDKDTNADLSFEICCSDFYGKCAIQWDTGAPIYGLENLARDFLNGGFTDKKHTTNI